MCKSGYFDNVEETDPGYIISEYINGYEQEIENIRVILMTNRETTPDIPASVKIDKVMVIYQNMPIVRIRLICRILVRMIHTTLKWKDCLERYMFR